MGTHALRHCSLTNGCPVPSRLAKPGERGKDRTLSTPNFEPRSSALNQTLFGEGGRSRHSGYPMHRIPTFRAHEDMPRPQRTCGDVNVALGASSNKLDVPAGCGRNAA